MIAPSEITTTQWTAVCHPLSYALSCVVFETIEALGLFQQYRIHPSDEEVRKNRVSRAAVLQHLAIYETSFAVIALVYGHFFPTPTECSSCFGSLQYWALFCNQHLPTACGHATIVDKTLPLLARVAYLGIRQFLALAIWDAWIFWTHYLAHANKWWFRNFHSIHHELFVPYSYGAAYNHWVESLCFDTVAALLSSHILGLSGAEQIFFIAAATFKGVENHCGYEIPWSPVSVLNRATGYSVNYHMVHHQSWGYKTNFATIFPWWDTFAGTAYKGPRRVHGPPYVVCDDRSTAPGASAKVGAEAASTSTGLALPSLPRSR